MNDELSVNAPQSVDRRRSIRRKFRGKIEIEWGSATLEGIVRDIGPQGLFIEIVPPLWVGARFNARLLVNPVLQLACVVRRADPERGIAVTFELVDETSKTQLELLLETLPLL